MVLANKIDMYKKVPKRKIWSSCVLTFYGTAPVVILIGLERASKAKNKEAFEFDGPANFFRDAVKSGSHSYIEQNATQCWEIALYPTEKPTSSGI